MDFICIRNILDGKHVFCWRLLGHVTMLLVQLQLALFVNVESIELTTVYCFWLPFKRLSSTVDVFGFSEDSIILYIEM